MFLSAVFYSVNDIGDPVDVCWFIHSRETLETDSHSGISDLCFSTQLMQN